MILAEVHGRNAARSVSHTLRVLWILDRPAAYQAALVALPETAICGSVAHGYNILGRCVSVKMRVRKITVSNFGGE